MDSALTSSSLAKQLASCDIKAREKALRTLKTWLPSQQKMPEDEMRMIWKGLFYCVWHADKQPVQLELINRLASFLVSLDLVVSMHYYEVFLTTMRREWPGIDFLRLDKFYLLFRRIMHNFFLLLKKNSWDLELLNRLMGVTEEKTLMANDKYPAQDKVQLNKIKSSLFGCLLGNGRKLLELRKAGDDVDSTDEAVLFGTIALNLGLSSKFLAMGSSSDCLQGNRKVLFALHEEFLKLEKDLENAGIEIPYLQVENNCADEVPDLIPIIGQEIQASEVSSKPIELAAIVASGSADTLLKKNKKAKKADLIPITGQEIQASEVSSKPIELSDIVANGSADKLWKKNKKAKKASE
ncbi:hypothetical protein NE237_023913 [Protea cynaroides]|uniref:Uncharacterized protein n=1 Tax=Protea cynaroides TaxID=273540 RepID=A0A9Q0HDP8_9MAGN|nr:hypothetical protein NE237_023913 [Protea cynaroides]